jgi:hypothetical protein
MSRILPGVLLLAILSAPPVAAAQDRGDDAAREKAFVETLRREDPASADRFVALRAAQMKARAEYQRAANQFNALPNDLRPAALPKIKQAERTYAEAELKILDFLDDHDRRLMKNIEADLARVKEAIEGRQKGREEIKKLLAE